MSAESPVQWSEQERLLLEERVAAAELAWLTLDVDVATLRVEIDNFALVHHQLLGPLYARLDELDALIAEAVAVRTGDPEALRRAAEARSRVAEPDDPAAAGLAPEPPAAAKVRPDREAQRIYRDLARRAHPDLTTDPAEQERRSAFIARVNEAYAQGDAGALEELADEWSTAPETAPDPDSPDRPDWLLRRLEWLTARIGQLATEQVRLERTPMGELLLLAPQEPERLLEELAEQLLARASDRRTELERLLGDDVVPGPAPAGRHNGGEDPSPHSPGTDSQETPTMFAQALPTTDAASVPADAALLDVREQDEWDAGHVSGALHIPIGQVIARLDELPDGKLYVLCRVGGRSAQVVQYLVAQGRDAVNVDGGMFAWEAAGRPMVGTDGRDAFVL
ncbi:rhodanese-like domain-containing protein [Kitasatospora sp. NPDC085879]|uniref:rhodanese-like domain-containing protein n=1 Tax=Kitasatospora sp. NPDC085879 TaxID=3154769 RepID=UPI000BC5CE2B|nr:rhodanese-like domain-containing protein [Streptomyces sp. TLI_235]PBC78575.1 rhodanese-related sulfurtransferase [Streptomyces sp. TLI_235]